jgi:hypothetical protein
VGRSNRISAGEEEEGGTPSSAPLPARAAAAGRDCAKWLSY